MLRRAILGIGGVLALLAMLVAAGLLFLQTEAGGRIAAQALARLASTPGEAEVSIAGIEPGLPSHLALRGLKLRDTDGEWLAIDRLAIDWRPLALLAWPHLGTRGHCRRRPAEPSAQGRRERCGHDEQPGPADPAARSGGRRLHDRRCARSAPPSRASRVDLRRQRPARRRRRRGHGRDHGESRQDQRRRRRGQPCRDLVARDAGA